MEDQFQKYSDVKSVLMTGNIEKKIPQYCFVIPTYQRPVFLKRVLKSVYGQIHAPTYNVVVVDNDSRPNTETERYLVEFGKEKDNLYYYKNEKNIGLFGNWNRCYQLARGEYCCILMDDDEVQPEYLYRVDMVLKANKIDCLRVGSQILDKNNEKELERNWLDRKYCNRPNHIEYISWRYFLFRAALPPSGMCVKKDTMLKTGGYNENYWPSSDFEMDMRLVTECKVALLWERLCITHTEDSTSMSEKAMKGSISQGLNLLRKEYDDICHFDKKLDWIAQVRTWIAIDTLGYKLEELEFMELDSKYNNKVYKYLYKGLYYIHRICQTIF